MYVHLRTVHGNRELDAKLVDSRECSPTAAF